MAWETEVTVPSREFKHTEMTDELHSGPPNDALAQIQIILTLPFSVFIDVINTSTDECWGG